MIAFKDVKVYVSPFAVISIMALHFSHSSKWPDPFKDEVTYVDNPIESGFPGHWLPLSIIKKIMEMRVLTLASEAVTNTQKNIKLKLHATTKRVKEPLTPTVTKTLLSTTTKTTTKLSTTEPLTKTTTTSTTTTKPPTTMTASTTTISKTVTTTSTTTTMPTTVTTMSTTTTTTTETGDPFY
ncbi:integumentary mucin C.1-like [Pieris rapae]|uniref:integumentary mucin C.1-like n=1 Tax=Pieris rapae TaxID=64459 RepID=UPI001E27E41E|nr:integumentary mucin C.1-like [Pieris rapae]